MSQIQADWSLLVADFGRLVAISRRLVTISRRLVAISFHWDFLAIPRDFWYCCLHNGLVETGKTQDFFDKFKAGLRTHKTGVRKTRKKIPSTQCAEGILGS